MIKILKNPLFWVGAVVGGAWILKNKPTSKAAQVIGELQEGGEDIVDSLVETTEDVWGIFEAGDLDTDIDDLGLEGADSGLTDLDDESSVAESGGDSNTGEVGTDIGDEQDEADPDGTTEVGGSGFDGGKRMSFNDYEY